MKRIALFSAFLFSVAPIGAPASEFDGTYVGVSLGRNRAAMGSSPATNSNYFGLRAGHNWDLGGLLLGGEVFVENHTRSYTGPDEGVAVRFGLPVNRWLPYVKLGVVGNDPGYRQYGGLGVAYALGDRWSASAEWTADRRRIDGVLYRNNDISIGLNFSLEAVRGCIMPPAAAVPATAADNSAAERAAAERAAAERAAAERAAAEKAAANKAPAANSTYKVFF